MEPVFVRHNMSSTPSILDRLWNERRIALHYENKFSTNPDDYSKGREELRRLWGYCKNGVLVGAAYRSIRSAHILVGELAPGSTIEAIDYDEEQRQRFVHKTVRLINAREVSLVQYPVLLGAQPRGGQ